MGNLPVISGRAARRAFERAGWRFDRQSGSHMILEKPGTPGLLSIPDHRELKVGLLRGLIRDAGISVEEFLILLGR
jgi:predicted RNA binding protein YcfA (HicA-like mRNA interferase family)